MSRAEKTWVSLEGCPCYREPARKMSDVFMNDVRLCLMACLLHEYDVVETEESQQGLLDYHITLLFTKVLQTPRYIYPQHHSFEDMHFL